MVFLVATVAFAAVVSCTSGRDANPTGGPYAPGVDTRRKGVDSLEVAHRLLAANEFELALDSYTRAALDHGMTPEILNGIGTANLGLGRLGQAETILRRAVEAAPDWPEAWNNLGVVLIEKGQVGEAEQIFRKAYALDNGESDAIRDNLRLALAKSENPDNTVSDNEEYKLVRRGSSDYVIRKTP